MLRIRIFDCLLYIILKIDFGDYIFKWNGVNYLFLVFLFLEINNDFVFCGWVV